MPALLHRRAVAPVLVAALAAAIVLTTLSTASAADAPPRDVSGTTRVSHYGRPVDAVALDEIIRNGDVPMWRWGDGAVPVRLPGGGMLFLFGDSLIDGADGRGPVFVNNTALIVRGDTISSTGPTTLIRTYDPDTYYWPSDAYLSGERLIVSLEEITASGEGGLFGFDRVDTDYAVVGLPLGENAPGIYEHGPWDDTALGDLVTVHVDDDPSIVNFRAADCAVTLACGSYLARMTDPDDPSAPWLWWDGSTWQHDPLRVADIARGLAFFDSRIINPVEHDGSWYATTWAFGLGARVAILSAPEVTGPWTELETRGTTGVAYLHALFEWDDQLVLRWSNNDLAMSHEELMRPTFEVYRPGEWS